MLFHKSKALRSTLSIFICLFLLTFVVAAQDGIPPADGTTEPPPTTEIPTEIPTLVPTDLPTVVPTEIPTEVPTEIPTDIPTDTPTEVVTEVPTETATPDVTVPTEEATEPVVTTPEATLPVETTPEITATATPSEPVLITLFTTNFDDGIIQPELSAPGWVLVNSENGQALQSADGAGAALYSLVPFAEGAVQARFLLTSGEARVFLRENTPINYTAGLTSDGLVTLYRADVAIQSVQLTLDLTLWHTLRLSDFGDVLHVSVDGVEIITTQDAEPFPPGGAGFSIAPASNVLADDLLIAVPEGSVIIPTPEATAEVTPEMTAEATKEVSSNGLVTADIACTPPSISMITGLSGAQPNYSDVNQSNRGQDSFDISANGRYIAYFSAATNLITGDDNANTDIFVFDRTTCSNERISYQNNGDLFPGAYSPSISNDGNLIAFSASAGGNTSVYVRNRQAGTTTTVALGNGISYLPTISDNGRYVAFYSLASDLVAGDTNNYCDYNDPYTTHGVGTDNCSDVFLYDLQTSTMTRVSLTNSGGEANFSADPSIIVLGRPAVSDNGQYVAFISYATNMTATSDTNNTCDNFYQGTPTDNCPDVFLRDTVNNTTTLMSQSTTGILGDRGVEPDNKVGMSSDGQYVLFLSNSDNLVDSDTNNTRDAFIVDTLNNTTSRASLADGGGQLQGDTYNAELSANGNFIAFTGFAWYPNSIAPNSPGGSGTPWNIYVYRRDTQQTTFVSKSASNVAGNGSSFYPSISADGSRLVFWSYATNLVAGDTYTGCDINGDTVNDNCPDLFVAPVTFPAPFLSPNNLDATPSTQTQITLSWTDRTTDEQGFRIERSSDGYNWTQIAQVAANVTTFNDNNGLCGTSFMYRVRAYKSTTNSGYSAQVTGTTQTCTPQACDPNAIIMRASTGSNGVPQGNKQSYSSYGSNTFSNDSRYLVFASEASNLVPGDTNGGTDIFRLDRQNCTVIRVSLADNEDQGDSYSYDPSISGDGNLVAFESAARNLVSGDTNGYADIFVRDILAGTTERVSINGAVQGDQRSYTARISADGRYVAFTSLASNFAAVDNNFHCETDYANYPNDDYDENCGDVFMYDRTTATLTLVSINSAGTETGNFASEVGNVLVIAGNPYVIFDSSSGDLIAADNYTCNYTYNPGVYSCSDVFIRDVNAGTTTLLSLSTAGQYGNLHSSSPYGAYDGTNIYVVYFSGSSNLVSGDTNNTSDIFLRTITPANLASGTTIRISVANGVAGAQGNNSSFYPVISQNGRYIAYRSHATNLVPGDTNAKADIFVRNVATNSTARVSVSASNVQGNDNSWSTSISSDGLWIVFDSDSSNLVPGDTNNICETDYLNYPNYDYNENCGDVFIAQNPLSALKPPAGLTATALSTTSIRLNWTDGMNETEYRLEHSTDNSNWSEIAVIPANGVTYTQTGLTCASLHYYRIRAYDASLTRYSSYSAPISKATLACPVVIAPVQVLLAANTITKNQTPTFTWNAAANSTSYEIQIATNNTFTLMNQTQNNIVVLNYTATTLTEGIYFWRVRAYNTAVPAVPGPWSTTRSFTIDTTAITTISNLVAPVNQAKSSTTRPTFSWSVATGATQYRLQVDEDSNFNTPEINLIVKGTSYITPTAVAPLLQGVQNWRVLAMDAAGNEGTNWSAVRTFTVFIGTAPLDGVFSVSTTPTFTWAAVARTTSYTLEIDQDGDFSSGLVLSQAVTGVSFKPLASTLSVGTYYWRVLRSGETPVDPNIHRTLFIGAAPAAPTLVSPLNLALTNDPTPNLTWNAVTSINPVVTDYKVTIATNTTFTTGLVTYPSAGTGTTFTLPSQTDGKIYWKVQAVFDGTALGAFSLVRSFTIDAHAPNPPNLSAPANAAVITTPRPTLTWVASPTANRYRVDLSTDSGFGSFVLTNQLVTTPSLALTAAVLPQSLPQGTYYWRVEAGDAAGNWSLESDVRSFTVFIGTAPLDGVFSVSTTPTFTWAAVPGVVNYTLQIDQDGDFSSGLTLSQTIMATTYKPLSGLLSVGTYYWRVLPIGETPANLNIHRTLFIGTAPAAPTLVSPANMALTNDPTPDLAWNAVTSINPLVTDYKVTIATNATFTAGVVTYLSAGTGTIFTLPSQTDGMKYWKVQAIFDGTALGAFSAVRSFTIDTHAPNPPVLKTPANAANVTTPTPTFTWTASATATGYLLTITGTSGDIVTDLPVTGVSYTLAALYSLPNDTYTWSLKARDLAGNPSAASTRTFTMAAP